MSALSEEQFAWRGSHRPADRDDTPMHDVEGSMPDFYDHPEYYRDHPDEHSESERQIIAARGNPDHPVRIYRAAPGGSRIHPGDWVTPSREYAQMHSQYAEGSEIIETTVPASHLFTEGNSMHEWGYHPS